MDMKIANTIWESTLHCLYLAMVTGTTYDSILFYGMALGKAGDLGTLGDHRRSKEIEDLSFTVRDPRNNERVKSFLDAQGYKANDDIAAFMKATEYADVELSAHRKACDV